MVIIIDALRYDFTVPFDPNDSQYFHNTLTILHETAVETPHRAFLLPFIADPPTTTLTRLKGLTTGTLPTFIDAGSNFAGTAIEEDNLVAQLQDAGKTMVHLGDDTWHALFPGSFDANLTHAYDSFNVWDLHTVDNGVTQHLLPLLSPSETHSWDVIFGHYLGVDHVGHQFGPNHPAMKSKLQQMDDVLRKIVALLDDKTLLVVMGDHGMDTKGDHGGESDDEIEAALWMYSKKGIFGREHPDFRNPPKTAKERPVGQIDLVPSLALLLGLPIPFNNLGTPIAEAFTGPGRPNWRSLAAASALTSAQIRRYQHEYSIARNLENNLFATSSASWKSAHDVWSQGGGSSKKLDEFQASFVAFSKYQKETLFVFKTLWAIFDIPNMIQGISVLAFTVLMLAYYARRTIMDPVDPTAALLRQIGTLGGAGAVLGGAVAYKASSSTVVDASLLGFAAGGIVGFMFRTAQISSCFSIPLPRTIWDRLSFLFIISQSIGFASNSYTIWEDEILLFFLSTFAVLSLASSMRQSLVVDRDLGISQSAYFLLLARLASLSRLCREEQMPWCRTSYYASSTSSTSAPWQLIIPFLVAYFLPTLVKSYYTRTRSYEGPTAFWIGVLFRVGLVGSAIFWVLDAAENSGRLDTHADTLKNQKTNLARLMLALAFAGGTFTFAWAKLHARIISTLSSTLTAKNDPPKVSTSLPISRSTNIYGSHYFLLIIAFALAIILLQKPMGGGSIALLTLQILSLLEILHANALSHSAIGPTILALLGSFHFFKTGHQATLSSIQWDSAFIPLRSIVYPWSPLLVLLNTFGAQILSTLAVPLIALWREPRRAPRSLLPRVVRAVATNILYYAVVNLATVMWAGWLRRHLMLYRIFNPRFMMGAAVLAVVDVVAVVAAFGAARLISMKGD